MQPHGSSATFQFHVSNTSLLVCACCTVHWLAVRSRIEYKLCLMNDDVRRAQRSLPFVYLSDVMQSADTLSRDSRPLCLRSADSSTYVKPRLRTKVGERAFSYPGPTAWNRLPEPGPSLVGGTMALGDCARGLTPLRSPALSAPAADCCKRRNRAPDGPDLPLLFKLHEIWSVDSQENH